MAEIIPLPSVQRAPYAGAQVDVNAAMAPARALGAVAEGLGQVGAVAYQQGMAAKQKREELEAATARAKALGDKARYEVALTEALSRQEQLQQTEQDESRWEAGLSRNIDQARQQAGFEQMAPEVRAALEADFTTWEAKVRSRVGTAAVNQSNARNLAIIEQSAEARVRAGQFSRAISLIDEANAAGLYSPDAYAKAKQRIGDYGGYYLAQQELNAIGGLPLRDQVAAYKDFNSRLADRSESGEFTQFNFTHGGMSFRRRVEMASVVEARLAAAQRQLDINALGLVRGLRSGELTMSDVGRAWDNGDVSVDVAAPMFGEAADEGMRREMEREQARRRAEEMRAGRVETAAFVRGTIGQRELQTAVETGQLTPERAAMLRDRLMAETMLSRASDGYEDISNRIDAWYAGKLFGFGGADSPQPSDAKYREVSEAITSARLVLPAKLELFERLLQAKIADVSDLEEEGEGRWFDRDISKPEASLRVNLLNEYKRLLPALGAQRAGALLFGQERMIREWFDSEPNITPEKVEKVRLLLMKQASDAAADSLLSFQFDE